MDNVQRLHIRSRFAKISTVEYCVCVCERERGGARYRDWDMYIVHVCLCKYMKEVDIKNMLVCFSAHMTFAYFEWADLNTHLHSFKKGFQNWTCAASRGII